MMMLVVLALQKHMFFQGSILELTAPRELPTGIAHRLGQILDLLQDRGDGF